MTSMLELRRSFHREISRGLMSGASYAPSLAKRPTRDLAREMVSRMERTSGEPSTSQALTSLEFRGHVLRYLQRVILHMEQRRPVEWRWIASQSENELQNLLDARPELKTAIGGDDVITPDIVLTRHSIRDRQDPKHRGPTTLRVQPHSSLRSANEHSGRETSHAIICCNWTLLTATGAKGGTELLNLARERSGQSSRIAIVTSETSPARLTRLAWGSSDVECTYHVAMHELMNAADSSPEYGDQAFLLRELVEGHRVRDISDLPVDLAI